MNRGDLYDDILRETRDRQQEKTIANFIAAQKLYDELVAKGKQSIDEDFREKVKMQEIQRKIKKSSLINRNQMIKATVKHKMCEQIFMCVLKKISILLESQKEQYSLLLIKFIVEGALRMFEPVLYLRCLAKDRNRVLSVLGDAKTTFDWVMNEETGRGYPILLEIDNLNELKQREIDAQLENEEVMTKNKEGSTCIGGIILADATGNITYKNTIDTRVNILKEHCLPDMRRMLWPPSKKK